MPGCFAEPSARSPLRMSTQSRLRRRVISWCAARCAVTKQNVVRWTAAATATPPLLPPTPPIPHASVAVSSTSTCGSSSS